MSVSEQIAALEDEVNVLQQQRDGIAAKQHEVQKAISALEIERDAERLARSLSPDLAKAVNRIIAAQAAKSDSSVGTPGT